MQRELCHPKCFRTFEKRAPGVCFSKVPKRFGPEKPVVKLRPAYSVKLVFSYVVKGIKIKITAKFRASRRLRFEDTKRIVTRNTPEKFRDFRETGPSFSTYTDLYATIFGTPRFLQQAILIHHRFLHKLWLSAFVHAVLWKRSASTPPTTPRTTVRAPSWPLGCVPFIKVLLKRYFYISR